MPSKPKKILVATELSLPSAHEVLDKAIALANVEDSIDVLYVVDPTTVEYTVDPTLSGSMYREFYETAMDNARQRLLKICKPYAIADKRCHVRYGRVAQEVHAYIQEGGFDCLMLGSHGRSGWQLLLGSKATSILHGVPTDAWVFKVDATKDEPNDEKARGSERV